MSLIAEKYGIELYESEDGFEVKYLDDYCEEMLSERFTKEQDCEALRLFDALWRAEMEERGLR